MSNGEKVLQHRQMSVPANGTRSKLNFNLLLFPVLHLNNCLVFEKQISECFECVISSVITKLKKKIISSKRSVFVDCTKREANIGISFMAPLFYSSQDKGSVSVIFDTFWSNFEIFLYCTQTQVFHLSKGIRKNRKCCRKLFGSHSVLLKK